MALVETTSTPEERQQARKRGLSTTGNRHSRVIKDGLRINRLIRKDLMRIVERQIEIATDPKYPASAAAITGQALIERVAGKPSSAPEDQATQLAIATILADMRPALALKLWPSQIDQSAPQQLIAATVIEQDDTAK